MDKQELISEMNKLEVVKSRLGNVKNILTNPDLNDKLSKIKYILSKDYLINDKNNKLSSIDTISSNIENRINSCNNIINSINIRISTIKKMLSSLD